MLFQVKQTYNEDDLRALHRVEGRKFRIHQGAAVYARISAFFAVLVLALSVVQIFVWAVRYMEVPFIFPILGALVWGLFIPTPIMILWKVAFPHTKEIDEDSLKKCKELTFSFFDDHFAIEDNNSITENQYSVMNKFIEKGDYFYIYIDVATAYIIRRSCFTTGAPEEFGPFMREKYRTKDMNTPEKGLDET